jgi:hypothetical protein
MVKSENNGKNKEEKNIHESLYPQWPKWPSVVLGPTYESLIIKNALA